MSDYENALALNTALQVEDAAQAYESILQRADAPIEAFINLACVYWRSTEFGFNAGLNLNHKFVGQAGNKMWSVLDQAEKKFKNYPEISFWRMYFSFTTLGEKPFVEECLQFVQQPNSTLVPYFHIYDQTQDRSYISEVKTLYQQCLLEKTLKNRYIISILENLI